MAQPRDLPSDLEWFRSLDFSPDDLDEDEERRDRPGILPGAAPAKAGEKPPVEKRRR